MRTLVSLLAIGLSVSTSVSAQDTATAGTCYHARPRPACSAFFLTNSGVYVGSPSPRFLMEWGLMANVGQRAAIGGSFFAIWDDNGSAAGPAVRYRRWFPRGASLDLGIGTPIATEYIEKGSIYGLVKWNPVHWYGLALRPEYVRQSTGSRVKLSAGVELGWFPGLALPVAGILTALIVCAVGGCGLSGD